MTASFIVELLDKSHDRNSFDCGVPVLDRYLKEQVGQDVRRRAAACYVAREREGTRVAGYYTLSAGDVALKDVPPQIAAKLPRYPAVPVARIGRLAIDTLFQKKRLGSALLWDAGARALRSEIAVFELAVDAKDEQAAAFYAHLGFMPFAATPMVMILPLTTLTADGRA